MIVGKNKGLTIGIFLLPAGALYTAFVVYSIIQVLFYSFFKWNGMSAMAFVGLSNYATLCADQGLMKALGNNLISIAMALVIQIGFAFLLAVLLMNCKNGFELFRSIFFLPVVISAVAFTLMFSIMFQPDFGLINNALRAVGLGGCARSWLTDSRTMVYASLLPQTVQYVGWQMVILLAGLMSIPETLFEAADLDGAGFFQRVRYFILPLLWEQIQVCIVFAVTGSLQGFIHVMVLTGGGPNSATELIGITMYRRTFQWLQFGYGSAIASFIFVLGLTFSLVFKRFFSTERVEY